MSSSPIPNTSSATTPLSTLPFPPEILAPIFDQVDLKTALSLALVSHDTHTFTLQRIWRDIDLSVEPLSKADAKWFNGQRTRWDDVPARNAKFKHGLQVQAKVAGILRAAEGGKLELAKSLRITPTASTELMADLLERSRNIRSLIIASPPPHQPRWQEHLLSLETLEHRMFSRPYSFPALTSLRITDSVLRFWEVVPLLTTAAPNLLNLSVKVDLDGLTHEDLPIPINHAPSSFRETKIRQLRLVFGDPDVPIATTSRFVEVIRQSPQLQHFSVLYDPHASPNDRAVYPLLIQALAKCPILTDLLWDSEEAHLRVYLDGEAASGREANLIAVRRLLFTNVTWRVMFQHIPVLANLEAVYLNSEFTDYEGDDGDSDLTEWDDTDGEIGAASASQPQSTFKPSKVTVYPRKVTHGMLPPFADSLRGSPRLHLIYTCPADPDDDNFNYFTRLDEIEAAGKYVHGRIRSIRHFGDELLIAHLLLPACPKEDIATPSGHLHHPLHRRLGRFDTTEEIVYRARDGSSRTRIYKKLLRPEWQYHTDYDGVAVPMEVVQKMQEVEDTREENWDLRGVEVGDKAWQVLLDWKETRST